MANGSVDSVIETKARTDGAFATAFALLEINKTLNLCYQRFGTAAYEDMVAKKALANAIEDAGRSISSALMECATAFRDVDG